MRIWRGHLERLRGVGGQPGGEQPDGQEAAEALDTEGCPPPAPDPDTRAQRRAGRCLATLVPGVRARAQGSAGGGMTSHGLFRSPRGSNPPARPTTRSPTRFWDRSGASLSGPRRMARHASMRRSRVRHPSRRLIVGAPWNSSLRTRYKRQEA